ncbi:MAG: hypothetical protein B7Z10_03690 [Rhodobacterales bacterium 32-66-7]|nr:MAG: hypothetical protein B7Z31_04465 [Rhodobacterales bacterium 12-65-15]OYX26305.1 MAG: hypothetical protein B7Z10_03690 [Rhodobacterales bacterium 32-66-7]
MVSIAGSSSTATLAGLPGRASPRPGHGRRATPCFTPGTFITTQRGPCPVEEVRPGDRVITRDNGLQPVVWTGKSQFFLHDFQAEPHLLPVMIRKGAFGKDLPERDMQVSPNHRMLVGIGRTTLRKTGGEALVAAKHLTSQGVQTVQSRGTTYVHFMCDRHEVVLADGIWTETFQPDDQSLKGIGNAQRLEILEMFPALRSAEGLAGYTSARPVVVGTNGPGV